MVGWWGDSCYKERERETQKSKQINTRVSVFGLFIYFLGGGMKIGDVSVSVVDGNGSNWRYLRGHVFHVSALIVPF